MYRNHTITDATQQLRATARPSARRNIAENAGENSENAQLGPEGIPEYSPACERSHPATWQGPARVLALFATFAALALASAAEPPVIADPTAEGAHYAATR